MLKPVIMIGCGGSGQKAVRYIRDAVRRQLLHSGWTGPFPQAWQFIGLDTLNVQESPGEIPTMPSADYKSVSLSFSTFPQLDNALMATYGPGTKGYGELIGWRPEASQVSVPLQAGAGQMRAVGRAAGVVSLPQTVRPKIQEAFTACSAGGPELQLVSEHLGVPVPAGTVTPDPIVVVLGSMAGGTGAGIMLDVIDLVRRTNDGGQFPIAVVFTADIFGSHTSDAMSANGMAFMSELMSAYWDNELSGSALIPANVSTDNRGPHSVFIVGRKNMDGIDLRSSKNVYRAVGEVLSSWVMSGNVQEQVMNFVAVNWSPYAAQNQGGYPFAKQYHPGVVSSFGSATLSIGRDRFREYASKLLLRESIEHLYSGHERRAVATLGSDAATLSSNAVIGRIVESHLEKFLLAAGLHERGASNNQIQDRFTAEARDELAKIRREIDSPFQGQERSGDEWAQLVVQQAQSVGRRAETDAVTGFDHIVVEWGPETLERTLRVTSSFIGEFGLKVAAGLVSAAYTEMNAVAAEVLTESQEARSNGQTAYDEALQTFRSIGSGKVQHSSSPVQTGLDQISKYVANEWLKVRREKVSEAMVAFAEQVLKPLEAKLEMAHGTIHELVTPVDGEPAVIETWPQANGGVPEGLLPSPVEFFLEQPTEWPSNMTELSQEAVEIVRDLDIHGLTYQPSSAVDAARYLLACGEFQRGTQGKARPQAWVDDLAGGSPRWTPGGQLRFSISVTLEQLEERVEDWLSRPSSPMSRVLNEGLRDYLNETDSNGQPIRAHAERLRKFRQRLGEALNQSKPLIELDTGLNAVVHPARGQIAIKPLVQGFPFPVGHPARDIVDEVLSTSDSDGTGRFTDRDAESVLISSFIEYPVHPMIVTSICRPLSSVVESMRSDPGRLKAAFWLWRRTKTLEDFVPLHDVVRRAMIRGFAVARMMGYITADPSKAVTISGRNATHEFPPLLTTVSANDLLPALLESFPLTLADAPTKQVRAFDAYNRMYELGQSETTSFALPQEVKDYLVSGDRACSPVDPLAAAQRDAPTINERKANMLTYMNANIERYEKLKARPLTGQESRDQYGAVNPEGTMSIELINDLLEQYELVRNAVEQIEEGGVV